MKRFFYCCLLLLPASLRATAQQPDSTIRLDLLNAPASPAFNILGIAPEAIERPTDLTTFMASVQQASGNFSAFPNSYAAQVAPFLLSARKYTLEAFDKNTYAFQQSFLISAGFTHLGPPGFENVDSLRSTKIGLGIKFSIVRPEWTRAARYAYTSLVQKQKSLLSAYDSLELRSVFRKRLDSLIDRRKVLAVKANPTDAERDEEKRLMPAIDSLTVLSNAAANAALPNRPEYDKVRAAAQAFKSERQGFYLDFNSGIALDFAHDSFDSAHIYQGGIWLSGGYEGGNQGLSMLFLTRFLFHPETVLALHPGLPTPAVSTFDAGGKLLLPGMGGRLVVNAEAIYRSVLQSAVYPSSWRLTLNAEYDIGLNRKLTFSFGRDFNGVSTRGGNVIAALNFIAGFGADRKVL